ncbi:hypothetical protein KJ836_03715 [Patescibacteria group bacterium]|nr:hypothetical protein [Patescibacteria group bacterium]
MIELFNTTVSSPIVIITTIVYVIFESIAIYDARLIQWKKHGMIPQNTPTPPKWTGVFVWLGWLALIALLLLNWKYGIIVWIIGFILKVLPILENIGKILTKPLIPKK